MKAVDDFLGAIGYALLIGLEYIKMAWIVMRLLNMRIDVKLIRKSG